VDVIKVFDQGVVLDFGDKHFVSSISQLGLFYIVVYLKEH